MRLPDALRWAESFATATRPSLTSTSTAVDASCTENAVPTADIDVARANHKRPRGIFRHLEMRFALVERHAAHRPREIVRDEGAGLQLH